MVPCLGPAWTKCGPRWTSRGRCPRTPAPSGEPWDAALGQGRCARLVQAGPRLVQGGPRWSHALDQHGPALDQGGPPPDRRSTQKRPVVGPDPFLAGPSWSKLVQQWSMVKTGGPKAWTSLDQLWTKVDRHRTAGPPSGRAALVRRRCWLVQVTKPWSNCSWAQKAPGHQVGPVVQDKKVA